MEITRKFRCSSHELTRCSSHELTYKSPDNRRTLISNSWGYQSQKEYTTLVPTQVPKKPVIN